jgi:hypothetical protein
MRGLFASARMRLIATSAYVDAQPRGKDMPITPYLQSKVFEPEVTKAMGIAFEKVCHRLGLAPRSDPVTESVAKVIIELAEAGERDPERLYQGALLHFGDHP